eukprot:TRINITY_DN152_c0_g1_i1.p1 TRINITY_DN152_c0_g1~~TRINITY_DN152_c0_g1_i1.p1  ORF type:complete len:235 (-),score=89.67 TRINITY_DN152_c0_g1_i1:98-802(-)
MEDYEQTLTQISQCFVYKLPPRTTVRGYRAADWNASEPLWQGRLKVISKGDDCFVQLIDTSTGELFAVCPVDDTAVEPVSDSSRYFVLRIESQGKHAFIGIGFAERNEAFDFNVALQDHKKYLRNKAESAAAAARLANEPEVDYSLKGPIKVSLGTSGGTGRVEKVSATAADDGNDDEAFIGLLAPPPKAKNAAAVQAPASSASSDPFGDWGSFGAPAASNNAATQANTGWTAF